MRQKQNPGKRRSKMKKVMVLALIISVPAVSFAQNEIPSIITIHEVAPAIEKIFTEPFETLVVITSDGKAITVTNQLARQVRSSVEEIEGLLKSMDCGFDSVELIIHNHPTPSRWSLQDKRFYHRLKREGYKGDFALYFPWSHNLRYMEETASDQGKDRQKNDSKRKNEN
jgi:hypothetical protein